MPVCTQWLLLWVLCRATQLHVDATGADLIICTELHVWQVGSSQDNLCVRHLALSPAFLHVWILCVCVCVCVCKVLCGLQLCAHVKELVLLSGKAGD